MPMNAPDGPAMPIDTQTGRRNMRKIIFRFRATVRPGGMP